jgi:hypothetical protein
MSYKHNFLALDIPVLKNFFDPAQPSLKCNKVVFRFVYDNVNEIVTLEAYGAKKNDKKFILPPVPLHDFKFGITLAPKGTLYVSDLELSRDMYDALGNPGAGDTHLIFSPDVSSANANSATYIVNWGKIAGFVQPPPAPFTGQELNPSPPADPAP